MDDFEKEIKQGFLEEATQLLSEAEQCFLKLESSPNDPGIIDQIFRLAHNLKGSSKAVGFEEMGAFTHVFESLLLKIKNSQIQATPPVVSLLLRCNDRLNEMIEGLKANIEAKFDNAALINELEATMAGQGSTAAEPAQAEAQPPAAQEPPAAEHSGFAEEAPSSAPEETPPAEAQPAMAQPAAPTSAEPEPLPAAAPAPAAAAPATAPAAGATPSASAAADESIRVSLVRLEKLINYVGELVIMQTVLQEQSLAYPSLRKSIHQLGKVTKEVQEISMSLRMVPLKQTFQKMQRIVRDTSNLLGKKVNLTLSGEETELDKTVLEKISDPLVHIIRNAVDHGIESAEKRAERGKPEAGAVWLGAYHQGGKLVIEIRDDGGGIDGAILAKKALEKGILKPGQQLSEQDAINLIFHPGFSTKAQVTEVSGRGVGMDVVKTNIQQLQGEVHVSTKVGEGSVFKIQLPLTLAIIDGMVVKSSSERYVIPLAHVNESLKPSPGDIKYNTGVGECLLLRGENLPLYRLSRLLGKKAVKSPQEEGTESIAVVFRSSGKAYSLLVDDIIGQQQIVIKKLGREVQNLKGFSGSAILGDGRPSLILEMNDLIESKGRLAS